MILGSDGLNACYWTECRRQMVGLREDGLLTVALFRRGWKDDEEVMVMVMEVV